MPFSLLNAEGMPDWFLFSKKRGIISLAVTEKFAIFKFCYEKSEILENKKTPGKNL